MQVARLETVDLLVLANSRKHGGRCIAGVRVDALQQRELRWVRLVDQSHAGGIWQSRARLANGEEPKILDVIQVTVAPPAMRSFQTENMQIENYVWHKVEPSPPGEDLLQWLDSTINDTMAWLFGFEGDYLDKEVTDRWKDPETLKLVHPKNIVWKVTTGPTGRRRCQATFTIGKLSSDDKPYTLVVTDPNVEQLLTKHPHGKYQESDIKVQDNVGYYWNAPSENLVFTVTLANPTAKTAAATNATNWLPA